ncbi:hypothetical protein CSEC_0072 [Criblamydia sequanensis CRIB-18]|uniref:Uncharacterized protein n=2 Tax=Candidatus Criblamydia sequanensis TaxID=340071 RepID=A0A090CXW4_9BACT|nr:hypothetical protein CSEC_0072 [Criblamydia sequanensis CRIB-18]
MLNSLILAFMEKVLLNQSAQPVELKRKEKKPVSDKYSAVRWKEASKGSTNAPVRPSREKKASTLLDEEVYATSEEWDGEIEEEVGSPLDLYSRIENKRKRPSKPSEKVFFNSSLTKMKDPEDFDGFELREKEDSRDEETQDNSSSFSGSNQPGLSSLVITHPIADNRVSSIAKIASTPKSALQTKLELLAEKMVQKLLIMKSTGKTEISITFKSGSFLGAKLSIVEFDSAKGEFNIQFDHLSSKAHALVTNPMNQDILKDSLREKGFVLHTLYATTLEVENLGSLSESKEREFSGDSHQPQEEDENHFG